jgi:hypothetical protein
MGTRLLSWLGHYSADSILDESLDFFLVYPFILAQYGPGVDSASQQKLINGIFLGRKGGLSLTLTVLLPSVNWFPENVVASMSHNSTGHT